MLSLTESALNGAEFALMQKEEKEERYCKQHSKAGILLFADPILWQREYLQCSALLWIGHSLHATFSDKGF
jgi:hypothetical protein